MFEKNTAPWCTVKAPPPYSWTIERALYPSGVTSAGVVCGSPETTTNRPPSVGRISNQ